MDGLFFDGKTLRMTMKTETGKDLILAFNIPEQKADDGLFAWAFQTMLPYTILHTTSVTGSIRVVEGDTERTVATFTATLDSIGLNRD